MSPFLIYMLTVFPISQTKLNRALDANPTDINISYVAQYRPVDGIKVRMFEKKYSQTVCLLGRTQFILENISICLHLQSSRNAKMAER